MAAWSTEQDRHVKLIFDELAGIPRLQLSVDPYPNGNPYSCARQTPDEATTGATAVTLAAALADGDPTVVARAHHADEGYIFLDAVELTDEEILLACRKVRRILAKP